MLLVAAKPRTFGVADVCSAPFPDGNQFRSVDIKKAVGFWGCEGRRPLKKNKLLDCRCVVRGYSSVERDQSFCRVLFQASVTIPPIVHRNAAWIRCR